MAMSPKPVTVDVELRTLGGVRVLADGDDITARFEPQRLALLVYLFHERRPLVPSEVLTLLGRAAGSENDLQGLAEDVRSIRRELSDVQIALTQDTVQALGGARIDTVQLDQALDDRDLETAERLYQGRFLEGFGSGSERFDSWVARERDRLERAWSHAIRKAKVVAEESNRWETAARWEQLIGDAPAAPRPSPGDRAPARAPSPGPRPASSPTPAASRARAEKPVAPKARPEKPVASKARAEKPAAPKAPAPQPATADIRSPVGAAEPETVRPTFIRPVDPVVRRRLSRSREPEVFTDSWLIHLVKTTWARLTTPRARTRYRQTAREAAETCRTTGHVIAGATAATLQYTWQLLLWLAFHVRELGAALLGGLGRGTRRAGRAARGVGSRARQVPRRVARHGAVLTSGVGTRVASGVSAASSALAGTRPAISTVGARWRSAAEAVEERTRDWGRARRSALRRTGDALFGLFRSVFGALVRAVGRVMGLGSAGVRRIGRAAAVLAGGIGRVQPRAIGRVALGFGLAVVTLLGAPVALDVGSQAWERAREAMRSASEIQIARPRLPEVSLPTVNVPRLPEVSLPDVSLPDVSLGEVDIPDIRSRFNPIDLRVAAALSGVPDAVTDSRLRLVRMLTGPLLPPGGRLVVADFEVQDVPGADPELGRALAVVLERYLSDSPYLAVVPRERAVRTLRPGAAASGLQLDEADALGLARSAEYRSVVIGRLEVRDSSHRLEMRLLAPDGRLRYRTSTLVHLDSVPNRLPETALRLRRVLGESAADVDAVAGTVPAFSDSFGAIVAWLHAREHLYADRFDRALSAARTALIADPGLASAYRIIAEAHGLSGNHGRARRALDEAWQRRDRLTERERLRVEADRHALNRRDAAALVAYEALFQRYRDDTIALKSQYLVRRRIDPGTGQGNLEVAYARDPSGWPSLQRLARFLDYRGPLPDPASLDAPRLARLP